MDEEIAPVAVVLARRTWVLAIAVRVPESMLVSIALVIH